jgi:hypothetical protein
MLALPLVPALSIVLVFVLSLALALLCAAIPWLARPLTGWALVIALAVGIALSLVGAVLAQPASPWADLGALLVAWSGGLLLGRGLAPRFLPVLLVFLCLSVLDVLLALAGYPQTPHTGTGSSPLVYTNFILLVPRGRFAINLFDLLLVTALAEHWRRRGAGYLLALLPGVLGFLLADGVVLATGLGQLPGFPFFTVGYVASEGVSRSLSRHRAAPPAAPAR